MTFPKNPRPSLAVLLLILRPRPSAAVLALVRR